MKRKFISLAMVLMAILCMQAVTPEEIVGIWETKSYTAPGPEEGMDIKAVDKMILKDDGACDFKSSGTMTLPLDGMMFVDLYMVQSGQGTYTAAGDSIVINLDRETMKMELVKDEIRVRGVEDVSMQEQIKDAVYKQFAPSTQFSSDDIPEEVLRTVYRNVVIMPKKIMCTNDDDIKLVFNQKKK